MKSRSAKNKGKRLQNKVAEILIEEMGIHADDIISTPAGWNGEDIILSSAARKKFPFAIECKNRETLNVWEALKQAETNAKRAELNPLVVFGRNRTEPYAIITFDLFIRLLKSIR